MTGSLNPGSRALRPSVVHLPPASVPPATLIEFLVERFPAISVDVWRERFARGQVSTGDGRVLRLDEPYRAHLQVRYFREVDAEPKLDFGQPRLVFHSDQLVVADKPPFQPVTPGGPWVRSSLLYQVASLLAARGESAAELTPVHRLDRATSGLVVFARRKETAGLYGRLFAEHRVEKVYEALAEVAAVPAERHFEVASRIEAGEPFFRSREVAGSPNAFSSIELLEVLEAGARRLGRFELRPLTGKKHQLRLHMAGLGWAILGDRYYPDLLPEKPDDPAQPLCLVARSLAFRDPLSGAALRFETVFRCDAATIATDRSQLERTPLPQIP